MNNPTLTIPAQEFHNLNVRVVNMMHLIEGLVVDMTEIKEQMMDDQGWYWTGEWQAMEQTADTDISQGNLFSFNNMEAALTHLNNQTE